jgi:hopanoid biosynthesis associated radical SAM protein HpnH
MKQALSGNKRYPLVLMLEPLFRCNLACAGCGKIDYPEEILSRHLTVEECLQAADECGAPIVSIPGGEPLIHPQIGEIVRGLVARKKFVYLCTNALLLKKKIDLFEPSPYLSFSIHLDGMRERHDELVCREGVFDKAVEAIKMVKERGFRVTTNSTLFDGEAPEEVAEFLDYMRELDVEGSMVSPGFSYERAPDQDHFLKRERSHEMFRNIFRLGKKKSWVFNQSSLYLDFLAGNQDYKCTPWGSPTRNIFGWQKPCYLLNDGYVPTFKELMETTDWDNYGTGNDERCADCMVHCGYEPTAVIDTVQHPLKALKLRLFGINTKSTGRPVAESTDEAALSPARAALDKIKVKVEMEAEVEH